MNRVDGSVQGRTQIFAVVFSILMICSVLVPFGVAAESAPDIEGSVTSVTSASSTLSGECTVVSEDESVQDAIDGADSWETICMETGTYDESLVIDVEGLTIAAADGAEPVLEGTADTGLEIEGAHNVTIEGLTIRGYGTYGIHVSDDGHNVTIQDTHIENSERGIWLRDNAASDATIEGNTVIRNGERGIHVGENNENAIVRANEISDNSGAAVNMRFAPSGLVAENTIADGGISVWDEDTVVRDNVITNGGNVAISFSHDGDYGLIENNTIADTPTAIKVTANAPEIRNNTINGSEIGLELDGVSTATVIDNELDSGIALDGSAGTFAHFDHEMTGNTLAAGELVFIKGEDSPDIPENAGQIIVVDSTNVNVSGYHLAGGTSGIEIAFSNGAVVTDNIVENTGSHGIRVWSSDDAVVSHNELISNGETSLVSGIGIHASSGAQVSNNSFEDAEDRALHVGNSPDTVVENNTFLDNHNGIHVTGSDRTVLQDNTITGTHHGGTTSNFPSAMLVIGSEYVQIRENIISDNHVNGIHDNRGSNSQYVTIEDNVIENNGNDGIYWQRSHDAIIRNNSVANNGRDGIKGPMRATVTGNTAHNNWGGIDVSHDSTVANNEVFDNNGNGVEANADSVIRDNTITDNGDTGIFFRYHDGQLVENNTVSGHVSDLLIYETEHVTVRDNTFETGVLLRSWAVDFDELATHTFVNNTVGDDPLVYVKDAMDVTISENAGQVIVANSTDVTVSDLEISGSVAGVQVAFSNGTVVSENRLSDSAGGFVNRGTITFWESHDSSVYDNVLVDNHGSGIELVDSTGTNVSANRVEGTDGPAIIVDSDPDGIQLKDNKLVNNDEGVHYASSAGADPLDAIDNWWGATDGPSGDVEDPETGTMADGSGDTVDSNVLFDPWTTDDPDGPGPIEVGECTVIDEAGSYVLTGDITNATGSCIEITANDVVLDGHGYEVSAEEGAGTYGILINGVTGVTVGNLAVSGWEDAGIKIQYANDVTISNVTAVDNPGHGIHLESTSNSALVDLTVTNNEDTGIQLDGSSDNTIHDVTTHESDGWHGVHLDSSHRNTLSNISTEANARDGIAIRHSSDNVLENITSTYNGQMGLRIADSSDHEIHDSKFRHNDRHGVSLEPNPVGSSNGADSTSLTNVLSEENGWSGVNIVQSNQNSLEEVTIINNHGIGLNFMGSSWNTVEDTVSEGNSRGILVGADMTTSDGDSNYNSFTDVSVNGNDRDSVTITDDGDSSNPAPSVGNEFERLTIGNHTVISFEGQMIELYSVDALPATPTGLENIGQYVEIVPESGAHVNSLSFHFGQSPVWEFDESDLELWRHDGAEWSDESDKQTLEADARLTVEPESTQLGIFAPLLSVDQEADVIVYGGSVDSTTVEDGELVTVTGNLFNAGTLDGNETIELSVDGDVIDEVNVTVAAGTISTVELDWEASLPEGEDSRTFDLTLNGFFVETVTVEDLYSDIQVIAASTSETEVVTGEAFHVIGSIYQAGTIDGPEDIVLNATPQDGNGDVIELGVATGVELAPGFYHLGAINITTDFEDDQAGTYSLQLGGTNAGTIEVETAESDIQVIAASASDDTVLEDEEFHVVGSIYQAGNVEGTEEINLTATNLDTNDTVDLGSQEATLAPGFYHLGALNITAEFEGEQAGNYSLQLGGTNAGQIEVEAAESDIQVIAASASEDTVLEDEKFHVVGSIYQAGNIEGTEEINLTATNLDTNDTVDLGSQEATLAPGFYHLGALNITAEFEGEQAGNYSLQLGGTNAGTIEVEAAESDIQVIAASASEDTVIIGEEFHVVGSIYQAGNVEGTEEINLTATNQDTNETVPLDSQEATLAPGFYHLGAINITAEFDEPGNYSLQLGGTNAGQIEVEAAESDIQVIAGSLSEMNVTVDEEFYVVGSLYQAGNIEGTEEINLTATNQDTNRTFHLDSQEATLAPNFYHLGAINITTSIDEPGRYDLTLGDRYVGTVGVNESPSDINVIAASLSEIEVLEEEELYVVGSIYQAGESGTEEIELVAIDQNTGENTSLGSQEVTLESGFYHLGAINITFSIDDPGTYDLELGGHPAGELEVLEAVSDIQVIAASATADTIHDDEEFHVVGSIYQAGNIEGTEEITLNATPVDGGDVVELGTQEATLSPGFYHLGAINITAEIDEPGTYDVDLGGTNAGQIEVEAAESDIQVIAASASADTALEDEAFHVVGSIYQAGNIEGTEEIELTATNKDTDETIHLGSQEATLAPGFYHLGAINITAEFDEPGNYSLQLGGTNAGQIEVEAAESDIQVIAASLSTTEIAQGQTLYVVGSIYQTGNIAGPEQIELTATHQGTGETEVVATVERELSPGFYHLGAINVSFTLDEIGTYDLALGDANAGTVDVSQPVVSPSIVAVNGFSEDVDPETVLEVVYVSDDAGDASVEIEIESDLAIDEVTLLVDSQATTYTASAQASHAGGDDWIAEIPFETIPDDGLYTLSVIAIDELGNAGFDNPPVVMIDTEPPSLAASIEDVDGEDATVVVESDEPLFTAPDVSVELPDGTTQTVTMTEETLTRFTGTLVFEDSGEYAVTTVGSDRAGNEGTANASIVIDTGFTLADGTIVIDETGTTIDFNVVDDADQAILEQKLFLALSENTVNANLDGGDVGVGFLTAELDSFLDYQFETGAIESAEISMAIDESELADGVDASDVGLYHYDATETSWDAVDSSVTTIDDDPYLFADVIGFSTYGALVIDETPPALIAASPTDGDSLDADTESVEVRFQYDDDRSGVDIRSISLSIDGADVTTDEGTQITSSEVRHTLAVEEGESYTATVTVADQAGNSETYETSFEVEESGEDPAPRPPRSPDSDSDSTPAISVVDVQPRTTTVPAGSTVEFTATLQNVGEVTGEHEVRLSLDDATIDSETVTIESGKTSSVTLSHRFDEPGTYLLSIGTYDLEITVESDDTDKSDGEPPEESDSVDSADETPADGELDEDGVDEVDGGDAGDESDSGAVDDPADDTIPGFGAGIAVGAIGLVVVLFARRYS